MELKLTLNENKQLSITTDTPMNTYAAINLFMNGCMSFMNANLAEVPDDLKQPVKEHIFDVFNEAASAVLAQFAPDINLRPDITEEAILQTELKLASKRINKSKKR